MFIIGLGDGLGNQMFQYAFYYAMKNVYSQSRVVFDTKYFYGSVNAHNGIELTKVFGIELPRCTKRQAYALADYHIEIKSQHPFMSILWGVRKILNGPKDTYLSIDDATAYYKEVFELNPLKSYYLRGNWINPMYFDKYRQELSEIFVFSLLDDEKNNQYMQQIRETNSVSVHIRAGDYLNNPNLEQLDRNYYDAAVEYIKNQIGCNIKLFVFSDDKEYARTCFADIENTVFIDCNSGENSYKDMQLMTLCKHNIIANSTFSFWGAYLNLNRDKIVIAPKKASRNCNNPFACDDWVLL